MKKNKLGNRWEANLNLAPNFPFDKNLQPDKTGLDFFFFFFFYAAISFSIV